MNMKELMDFLQEAGVKKSIDEITQLRNSEDLIAELLAAFNINPDNTKVTDYARLLLFIPFDNL